MKKKCMGCSGNMFIISRSFLNLLEKKAKILYSSNYIKIRRDRMCLECILGLIIIYILNLDISKIDEYSLEEDLYSKNII